MATATQSKRTTTHPLRTVRRDNAAKRQATEVRVADLTAEQVSRRLEVLDERLGAGVGATRERARLARRLAKIEKAES